MAKSDSGEYGGFVARFFAFVCDMLIASALMYLVIAAMLKLGLSIFSPLVNFVGVLVGIGYYAAMQSSASQATIGKGLLGLKVATVGGDRASFLRNLGREFAKIISWIPLGIGFLMAAFTGRKQALHDMVASTVVLDAGPAKVMKGAVVVVAAFAANIAIVFFGLVDAVQGEMGKMMAQMGGVPGMQADMPGMPPMKGMPTKPAPTVTPVAPKVVVVTPTPAPQAMAVAPTPPKAASTPAPQPQSAPVVAAVAPKPAQNAILPFLGKWRSDAELTLRDMATRPSVTEKQRRFYESVHKKTGGLVLVISGQSVTSYFANEEGRAPAASQAYAIVDSGPRFVVLESPRVGGGVERTRLDVEGKCIFTVAEGGGYREYFCPAAPVAVAAVENKPAPMAARSGVAATAAKPAAEPPAQEPPAALPADMPARVGSPPATASAPAAASTPAASADVPPPASRPGAPGPKYNDLMSAVLNKDVDGVNELLAFGKWADKGDSRGVTPLMIAVRYGDAASAEALLKAGADPNRNAAGGENAMKIAAANRDAAMTALLERYKKP
jgi:uncharacterized RDD family membrane protein YckC